MGNCFGAFKPRLNSIQVPTQVHGINDLCTLQHATYKNTPPFFPSFTECKVVKVYDGDTFHVAAIVDNKIQRFMIRSMGYDSPELRTKNSEEKKAGLTAKQALSDRIEGKMVEIKIHRLKDKYGRLLATISDQQGDINQWMLKQGYGVPYTGGTKLTFQDVNL
jgi:endonuclease YncB( thermonuclease family)